MLFMAVSRRVERILWTRAGGRCSFPECGCELIEECSGAELPSTLGEIAHIVARKTDGPRGAESPPGGEIDGYDNLILLCHRHHELVDSKSQSYPAAKLVQMRTDHESRVAAQLSPSHRFTGVRAEDNHVEETVHSTLLTVVRLPMFIYSASCALDEGDVKQRLHSPSPPELMLPFVVRSKRLYAFFDLRNTPNPFCDTISPDEVEKLRADDCWSDPDRRRWYVSLLNRSLNKLTGRKGLMLDKDHKRYYFEPREGPLPQSVQYRTLTGRRSSRHVAYQPKVRSTGEYKKYWEHWAVGLRFHQAFNDNWCLSLRPERRFTRDGFEPITPKGTGRRSTSP